MQHLLDRTTAVPSDGAEPGARRKLCLAAVLSVSFGLALGHGPAAVAAPVVAVAEKVEDAVDDLVEAVDAALDADEEE